MNLNFQLTELWFFNQIKGQEEIKASIDGSLKSLSDQMSKVTCQEKLQEILLAISTLPKLIEASVQKLQNELHNTYTKEMQARTVSQSMMTLKLKHANM